MSSSNAVKAEQSETVRSLAERQGIEGAVGARTDGGLLDLRDEVEPGQTVDLLTPEDEDGRSIYWHTTAHVLAQAVKMYFGDDAAQVKLGVGPPIEEGFYYDFDLPRTLSEDELDNIERIMENLIRQDLPLERRYLPRDDALEHLDRENEELKVELAEDMDGDELSFYQQGDFEDLCAGPHLPSTGAIGAVKLTKLSGAYWKGDQSNRDLQRIYGISFPSEEEKERYEKRIELAKQRDHRKLGRDLDLFHIENEIGPGLVVWHPNGSFVRSRLEDYWRDQHEAEGYSLVHTPHLANEELWETSGHLEHYADDLFPALELDDRNYRVKPMNCPFHVKIFNSDTRSYRDLPMRLAELGTVYRMERSGVLHGLLRVRGFTQDDAHIFCEPDQVHDEVVRVMEFIQEVLTTFGFEDYEVFVSTQPEDYVGRQDRWDLATEGLREALETAGLAYEIDPGEGVFYGPKIDLKIRDSLGRRWQCSTVQVDFNLPERFDVEYVADDGSHRRPIMIHRALFGSLERFFGCLVEHYGGAFPPWLAPTVVRVLPVDDANLDYARTVRDALEEAGARVEVRSAEETLGKRIHRAQSQKIPYTLIVGSDEEESDTVEVREYGAEDSYEQELAACAEDIRSAIENRETVHEEPDLL